MDDSDINAPSRPPARCPICGQPSTSDARPFCSRRCKDVDLGRWLSGSYRIAGGGTDEDGGETDMTPPDSDLEGGDADGRERQDRRDL